MVIPGRAPHSARLLRHCSWNYCNNPDITEKQQFPAAFGNCWNSFIEQVVQELQLLHMLK